MSSDAHEERLSAVVRTILNLRLFAVAVTLLYLPTRSDHTTPIVVALIASLTCSFVPLLLWRRISDSVLRHPTWLALDLGVSIAVLAIAGPESPFFLATLGTAVLAGIIYGIPGAIVFTGMLLAGWALVVDLRPAGADELSTFATVVTLPALYPLCAAGGAAVRRLLDEQARTERSLLAAERASSISAERVRMAREMHDSVGKSLQGIALSASALAMRAAQSPGEAGEAARALAGAAKVAAGEARELIGDLRADDLEGGLHEALAAVARSWAQTSGVALELDVRPVDAGTEVRYELLAIAKEALRNVERHAGADCVRVVLETVRNRIVLSVIDDGRGLPAGHDADELVRAGHFGLLGMRERAERLGGGLDVVSEGERGTRLTALVPTANAAVPDERPARRLRLPRGLQGISR